MGTGNRTVWEGLRKRSRSRGSEQNAFDIAGDVPVIRVIVDPQLRLDADDERYFELLRAHDPGVHVLRRREKDALHTDGDYAVLRPAQVGTDNGWGGIIEIRGERAWQGGIPYAENNIEAAYNWAKHYGLDPDAARTRALDAEAATTLDAQLYVTDNAYALHGLTMRSACSLADAQSVIGLHQRLRSHVLVGLHDSRFISTWMAEHTQALAMLPAVSAQFGDGAGTRPRDETLALLRAMLIRLKRALRARDRLLVSSLHPDGILGFEEPDELVERTVISLQGLFDAAARALNAELTEPAAYVSYGQDKFLRALPANVRTLVENADNRAVRGVIAALRNTIHNEPFGRAAFEERGEVESLATLEGQPADSFREHAARLGQMHRWTLFEDRPPLPGHESEVVLRPVALVDDLIALSAGFANALIASAPWALPANSPAASPADWSTYPPFVNSVQRGYGLTRV